MSDRRIQITDAARDSVLYGRIDGGWADIGGTYLPLAGGTLTGSLNLTFAAVAGVYGSTLNLYSGNPQISIHDTGAAANEGVWNIIGGSTTLKIRALSDDFATAADAITIERGTGATIDDVKLTLGATGALEITGSSYKTNPTGIRIGQYSATVGYIQTPTGGAVHIWDDATVNIATFNDDGTVDIPQGTLELGTYATTTGGVLKINGTTANKQAELICTNGNLHIDSNDGQQIYLNYYSNTGGVYIGAAGGFKSVLTGQYGSVQTQGSTGGYGGVSLAGNFALMNSGSAHVGLYDDINNKWMILAYPNSYVSIYYNGTHEIRTQGATTAGNGTGAIIRHNNGTYYDIGLHQMPRVVTNASVTLADEHAGGYMYHSNSTVYTITLNNSSPGGADFPIGSTFFVLNYGTGNVTVNTGSGTLYNPQLGTGTTGSRTIGGNSVATILKYAADSWFVWGDNVT